MDALAFLGRPPRDAGPLYVLHGDETFLKRLVLHALRASALGPDAPDEAVTVHAGDRATFAEVFDELDTVPFFFARRLVVIDAADPFVTGYRAELERKVATLSTTGTLVLDVKTWAANTRLAKLVDASATIVCKAPAASRVAPWCSEWALASLGKQLPAPAAALLVELIGPEMGLLDQELQKLAAYVGKRDRIDLADVDRLVGNSRAETTWKIFDAIAVGNVKDGLAILDRLFVQGEEPLRMLGAFASQLRRLVQAYRLKSGGLPMAAALAQAGVPPFVARSAEQQMRHLGRYRLEQLYDWLLQLNLDLRGSSTLPERTLFERLLVRLSRPIAG